MTGYAPAQRVRPNLRILYTLYISPELLICRFKENALWLIIEYHLIDVCFNNILSHNLFIEYYSI